MKRNSFLRLFISAAAFLTVPFSSTAKRSYLTRNNKGFKVDKGNDRFVKPITLLEGDTFYTKISSKDTDGDLYMFESTREKKGGPSLHYHYTQDEWWYILEGEFLIKVGDQMYTAKAGDSVFGPRGVPHAFSKMNEGSAKMIMTFQPAGKMEEFFIAVSEGKLAKMSEKEQDEMRKAHGFERVGPAIGHFKKL
ncbi:hypothetical protein ADIARSV_0455 [Arcticibacter svalbardensis MN12-7]|uniref:Cupin type-2 domain-containing protein n=1 Tax=Arcticibacter svalbardensis MN12-7 TaxID=1150600 RepID=R9GXW6_9SPHI|nr:cupin domain-containing protein [Arcticibacter svalbardensis]EOR96350.1 hypothetical protein ADIARSV_0455 [Arcticibacter svalbardensis MN12-7]